MTSYEVVTKWDDEAKKSSREEPGFALPSRLEPLHMVLQIFMSRIFHTIRYNYSLFLVKVYTRPSVAKQSVGVILTGVKIMVS